MPNDDQQIGRQFIIDHRGNISSMAAFIGVNRYRMTQMLSASRLMHLGKTITGLEFADSLRVRLASRGPRSNPRPRSREWFTEKKRIVAAIAKAGGYRGAAALLGLGEATVARRMKFFGITTKQVKAARQRSKRGKRPSQ